VELGYKTRGSENRLGKATDKCQSEAVRANIGIQGLP